EKGGGKRRAFVGGDPNRKRRAKGGAQTPIKGAVEEMISISPMARAKQKELFEGGVEGQSRRLKLFGRRESARCREQNTRCRSMRRVRLKRTMSAMHGLPENVPIPTNSFVIFMVLCLFIFGGVAFAKFMQHCEAKRRGD